MTTNTSIQTSTLGQTIFSKMGFSQLLSVKMNALVWSWLGLMALGWVMVMSASTSIAETYTGNPAYFSIRHSIYILLGIVIAFLTISFQSVKAALANPVESLRNE